MKVLFAGEGGQGVQVMAEILSKAAFAEGKLAIYIPNFGVEQRGGVSLAFVVVSDEPVVYPKFEKADLLAILSDRSIERVKNYIDSQTKVILGPAVTKKEVSGAKETFCLDKKVKLTPRTWNIVVLGKVNRVGMIVSLANLKKAMNKRFEKQFEKRPELKKLDEEALVARV